MVNHWSRQEVVLENGRIYRKNGDRSTYILISQDSILSKETKLFGHRMNVIGRTCEINSSVNATVSPSANPLFKEFHFKLLGNLSITETCPSNESDSSFEWTISADSNPS